MRFVFADSLDFIDPAYNFAVDRNGVGRVAHRDDQFPHEFLDEAPYDGILVSRSIVGDASFPGKYTEAQMMRFRREGARPFLRYPLERFPGSLMMGDCGAFTYRDMQEPPYRVDDTVEFYADGGFTHGFSPDHLIFDFDDPDAERSSLDVPEDIRRRYDITLQNAAEFFEAAKRLGRHFTPVGVIQGWSAASMATAAHDLVRMGYRYLSLGGTVPLRIGQVRRALDAVRQAVPANVLLHVLGFGKIEHLADLEAYGVASFDTTSPLLRAFKDARKNYWVRGRDGELRFYTAIRIPQATDNSRLKRKALEGRLNQEEARSLEEAALSGVRRLARREAGLDEALDTVIAYWTKLNWNDESDPQCAAAVERQRRTYARTLADRPWESCDCRVCREGGIEALIFRNSNRNKRRGMHNLHVFHRHLQELRVERGHDQ